MRTKGNRYHSELLTERSAAASQLNAKLRVRHIAWMLGALGTASWNTFSLLSLLLSFIVDSFHSLSPRPHLPWFLWPFYFNDLESWSWSWTSLACRLLHEGSCTSLFWMSHRTVRPNSRFLCHHHQPRHYLGPPHMDASSGDSKWGHSTLPHLPNTICH